MRAFVDTNVLLDVLAKRMPFYTDAARIWTLAESSSVEAYISVMSFPNCYYILRKQSGRAPAEEGLRVLRDTFRCAELTSQILVQAIDAGFNDFEDAIQYHSAVAARCECIVTRNPAHFPRQPLSVLSPSEFLAYLNNQPAP